ncbi:MAG: HAMP domain-containing histidine kinase [Anaerofustis stercorihominis]|nr:HAMP domain-containing histidine kinase [Anaerofustis stercorihominis]
MSSSKKKNKGEEVIKRFKNEKLYRRLNLSFSVLNICVTAVALMFIVLICFFTMRSLQKNGLVEFSKAIYDEIISHKSEIITVPEHERAEYAFNEFVIPMGDDKLEVGIALYDSYGRYSDYRSLTQLMQSAGEQVEFQSTDYEQDEINVQRFRHKNIPYMMLISEIDIYGHKLNLFTFQSTADTNSYMLFLSLIIIITMLLSLGMMFVLGIFVSKKALAPLEGIANSVKSITEENLSVRLKTQHIDGEVDSLIIALNNMLQRLSVSFEMQKQFVNDVSHEMRIPLTIIQGNLDIITSWGKDDEKILTECLDAIADEVRNIKNMMERLLFLHNVTSGNYEFDMMVLRASRLLNKVYNDTRLLTQEHNVILDSKLKEDTKIYVDRLALEASIRALVDNSIKYTPESGNIILHAYTEKNMVKFAVEDTGCGIEEEYQDKIFNRFFRTDSARRKTTGGSGLGLAIVKATVEAMGGDIRIESVYQKGTTAVISIPIYTESEKKEDKHGKR